MNKIKKRIVKITCLNNLVQMAWRFITGVLLESLDKRS